MMIQLVNSIGCYYAANVPWLFFMCIMLNYMATGATFCLLPVATTNVYGLVVGPQVYVQVIFGSFCASLLNVFTTEWLLPALPAETGFRDLYFVGSVTTIMTLVLLFFYKEELDVDRLEKRGLLKESK